MNVLSLFDGMSGAQIAINRIAIKNYSYYASEIDKYAIKVTQANYPNTIQLGDITQIKTKSLPGIDLLIGGSPCQGFSRAGKKLNFDDPRSKLFFEYVRILEELNPKYFLLENVKMKKEYQDVISEKLGVEPIEINSALVSAQNRKRLYWTNIPNLEQPKDKNIILDDILDFAVSDREKSYCLDACHFKTSNSNPQRYINKSKGQIVFEIPHGFNKGGIKLKEKMNALRFCTKDNYFFLFEQNQWRKLTPVECERLQTVPDNYTNHVSNTQRYKMLGNGFTVDVIAHILQNVI